MNSTLSISLQPSGFDIDPVTSGDPEWIAAIRARGAGAALYLTRADAEHIRDGLTRVLELAADRKPVVR